MNVKARWAAAGVSMVLLASAAGGYALDRLAAREVVAPAAPRANGEPGAETITPGAGSSPTLAPEQLMAGGARVGPLMAAPADGRYAGTVHAVLPGSAPRMAVDLQTTIDATAIRHPGTRVLDVAEDAPVRLSIHRGSKPGRLRFAEFAERFNGSSARSARMRDRRYWVSVKGGSAVAIGEYGPAYSTALSPGDEGRAVTSLQKRLKDLHYDVGAVDGRFGYDTTHALVAFEKVNGLPRDQDVDGSVWRRLYEPVVPTLDRKGSGSRIEVDLTRQVLYLAEGKRIVRIVDVSTGGGLQSYADGSQHIASTPTGNFRIFQYIPGWYESSVGPMYESNFFAARIAIHGSGSVPPYPASHGCVRVTVPGMDRLLPELQVGMPVSVYRS